MSDALPAPRLRVAMVGGGREAFIGRVHRQAMALDGQYELVSGALSSQPDKARASGRDLGLAEHRNHGRWQDLLAHELSLTPEERVHAVVIVTPNDTHYPIARAFVDAGFHVVCDKPLVHTVAQAEDLAAAVARRGTVFAVTYNYSGYPMVREARAMVQAGLLGHIRKVVVEYHQGWLARAIEAEGHKQAAWRTDPARSGAGAIGDIGSHAEQLAATVTGLHVTQLCADLRAAVSGRAVDDDANLLLRFHNGAAGVLMASQIATGCDNDLRLRVFGSEGSLHWCQERPERLEHAPIDGPRRVLVRDGTGTGTAARGPGRLPAGHPEGFIEAFANLYLGVAADIRARLAGRTLEASQADYPRIDDGVRGVRFIEAALRSTTSNDKWTAV